jgi:prepilin-type processing-associated H-X9-DG protein
MKRLTTFLLQALLLAAVALLATGAPVFAQETKGEEEIAELRRQNELLRRQVEELRQELIKAKVSVEKAKQDALKYKDAQEMRKALPRGEEEKAREEALRQALQQLRDIKEQRALPGEKLGDEAAEVTLRQVLDALKWRTTKPPSKEELARATEVWEELVKRITPDRLSELLKVITPDQLSDLLAARAKYATEKGISRKTRRLDEAIIAGEDVGLLTQLRFEQADLLRKLGKNEEAVKELRSIIKENADPETTNTARWSLIEILQEQKVMDEALAELKEMLASAKDPEERRNALYGMLNLAGDDPEARLRATREAINWLQGAVEKAREKTNRAACAENLREIAMFAIKWAEGHAGKYPEKLSDLRPFGGSLDYNCPSAGGPKVTTEAEIDSNASYRLRKGLKLAEGTAAKEILIYELPSQHGGQGGNVAYCDGHVEWLDASALTQAIAKLGGE